MNAHLKPLTVDAKLEKMIGVEAARAGAEAWAWRDDDKGARRVYFYYPAGFTHSFLEGVNGVGSRPGTGPFTAGRIEHDGVCFTHYGSDHYTSTPVPMIGFHE